MRLRTIHALRRLASLLVAAAVVGVADAATDGVTIHANHAIAEDGVPLLLSGAVSSGRRGEAVTIEQDDCGPIPWHPLRTVRTGEGGGWVSYAGGDQNFRLRARWKGSVSKAIRIGVRPELTLAGVPGSLRVVIRAYDWFGGKTAQLQRASGTRWQTVAAAKLVKRGSAGQYAQTWGTFTKKVGRGLYRAVLPNASAAPCYAAGFSGTLRL
jgi:hypothetical protein